MNIAVGLKCNVASILNAVIFLKPLVFSDRFWFYRKWSPYFGGKLAPQSWFYIEIGWSYELSLWHNSISQGIVRYIHSSYMYFYNQAEICISHVCVISWLSQNRIHPFNMLVLALMWRATFQCWAWFDQTGSRLNSFLCRFFSTIRNCIFSIEHVRF